MLFGMVSRNILLGHPETNSSIYSVVRYDWNFKGDLVLWSDET